MATAETARVYRKKIAHTEYVPGFNLDRHHQDIDAVYVPEMAIDIAGEAKRLKLAMDRKDCVNIFVSEGAWVCESWTSPVQPATSGAATRSIPSKDAGIFMGRD